MHCGMAMRLWDDQVAILAKYGQDFPAALEAQLKQTFISDGIIIGIPTNKQDV